MRLPLADACRALRRPWPWVLRYGLSTLPACLLALLIVLPLESWFRVPLLIEALESRSLGKLGEFVLHMPSAAPAGWLVVALMLIPVAWVIVQLIGLWIEGGILATYAHPEPPTWRGFVNVSTRAVGSFALLVLVGVALTLLLLGATVVLAVVGRALWPQILTPVVALGAVAIGCLWVLIRLARAYVIVGNDRHLLGALSGAWRAVRRDPWSVLVLVVGAFALRGALVVASGAVIARLPLRWWLLTLVIQQGVQLVTVGVGLLRRAGEVALVRAAHVGAQNPSEGSRGLSTW